MLEYRYSAQGARGLGALPPHSNKLSIWRPQQDDSKQRKPDTYFGELSLRSSELRERRA